MEQQNSYDPDRTVTINSGDGLSPGFVLAVLGFIASLVAVVGIGVVSMDAVGDDIGSTPSTQQEQEADSH